MHFTRIEDQVWAYVDADILRRDTGLPKDRPIPNGIHLDRSQIE